MGLAIMTSLHSDTKPGQALLGLEVRRSFPSPIGDDLKIALDCSTATRAASQEKCLRDCFAEGLFFGQFAC